MASWETAGPLSLEKVLAQDWGEGERRSPGYSNCRPTPIDAFVGTENHPGALQGALTPEIQKRANHSDVHVATDKLQTQDQQDDDMKKPHQNKEH